MGRIDEGQAVIKHLTLSDLKMWSLASLNPCNNYTITMTNKGGNMSVFFFSLLIAYELI